MSKGERIPPLPQSKDDKEKDPIPADILEDGTLVPITETAPAETESDGTGSADAGAEKPKRGKKKELEGILTEFSFRADTPETRAEVLARLKELAGSTEVETPAPATPEKTKSKTVAETTEQRTRITELAKATRGEAASKLIEKELETGPKTTKKVFEEHAQLTERMLTSEQKFFEALKKHHKGRGVAQLSLDQLVDLSDRLPKNVQKLRDDWMAARRGYFVGMQNSLTYRYVDKHTGGKIISGRKEMISQMRTGKNGKASVAERYERRYGVAKAALTGAEEAMLQAKQEGMNSREKKMLDKMLEKYQKLPAHTRILATSAVMTTAGAAVTMISGGTVLLVPLAIAGGSTAVSAYLSRQAEKAKPGMMKSVLGGAAGLTSVAGWAGWLGNKLTKKAHSVAGTKEKAEKELKRQGKLTVLDINTASDFAKISAEFQKAAGSDKRIERDARRVQILSSIAGGVAFGSWLSHNAPHIPLNHAHGAGGTHSGHVPQTGHEAPTHTTPETHPATPAHSAPQAPAHAAPQQPPAPAHHEIRAQIEHRGEGADRLYRDLITRLHTEYPDAHTAPPLVQQLFAYRSADQFAQATGFESIHGNAVMHMAGNHSSADAFSVSADGKELTYIDSHGQSHVLATTSPQNEVYTYQQSDLHMQAHHVEASGTHHGATPDTHHDAGAHHGDPEGDARIAELNRAQLHTDANVHPAPAGAENHTGITPPAPSEATPTGHEGVHGAPTPAPEQPHAATPPSQHEAVPPVPPAIQHPGTLVSPEAHPQAAPGIHSAETGGVITTSHGLTIDTSHASGFEDGHHNLFAFGGTVAERQALAVQLARSHPGQGVFYEERPLDFGHGPQAWTSLVVADSHGNILQHQNHPDSPAAIGKVPNPDTFTASVSATPVTR